MNESIWRWTGWIVGLTLALSFPVKATGSNDVALVYEEPKHLTGAIDAQGTGDQKLLFKFTRIATRSGSTLDVVRVYSYPDGTLAARERIRYDGNALVRYELEELQIGAFGSAAIQRTPQAAAKGLIEFAYTKTAGATGRPQVSTEVLGE